MNIIIVVSNFTLYPSTLPLGSDGDCQWIEAELERVLTILRFLGLEAGTLGLVLLTTGSLSSPAPPRVTTRTIIWR